MKKVMIILPTLALGGQQRVAIHTSQVLSDEYEVFFTVFDTSNAVFQPTCPVIDLKMPATSGLVQKVFQVSRRCRRISKLIKKNRIDYCISFGPTANIVNVLSRAKCKRIINLRGYASANDASILSRYMFRKADVILCCSGEINYLLENRFPELKNRLFRLYNPYDISYLRELGKEKVTDYSFTKCTIVTHGRLNAVKNYTRLIKAFSIVHYDFPDTQLLIIGEGEMREKLEALIRDLDLNDSVFLPGFRKNPFAYLAKSDLYVLSSFSEGFPNALVEGMTFLPVVSVDCPSGPCEILKRKTDFSHTDGIEEADFGILVRPADRLQDTDSREIGENDRLLAEAMERILRDPEKARSYREKAALRALDFSFESYRERLNAILNALFS